MFEVKSSRVSLVQTELSLMKSVCLYGNMLVLINVYSFDRIVSFYTESEVFCVLCVVVLFVCCALTA